MQENVITIASQVAVLYLLMAVGFICFKTRLLTHKSTGQLTDLLLTFVTPAVIISSFQIEFDFSLLGGILLALGLAVFAHMIPIAISLIFFRKESPERKHVFRFATIFSNCGFMAIPLVQALLGSRGVLYAAAYLAVFNVVQWTYGVVVMTGDVHQISVKKAFLNPGVIGLAAALVLFFLPFRLPDILASAVGHLANLNTPLAMIVIGCHIASADLKAAFLDRRLYLTTSLRLLVSPLILFAALLPFGLDKTLLLALLVPASAPCAATTALFSAKFKQDTSLASSIVTVSTLLSTVTMPLIIAIAS